MENGNIWGIWTLKLLRSDWHDLDAGDCVGVIAHRAKTQSDCLSGSYPGNLLIFPGIGVRYILGVVPPNG